MSPLFASVTSLGMTTLVSSKADQGAEESAKAFPRGLKPNNSQALVVGA